MRKRNTSVAEGQHPQSAASPTAETYAGLQAAYDFFNARLFAGALPGCLITLQRKAHRTYGYYAADRYVAEAGQTTDEIALNPRHFRQNAALQICGTLVHEMTHQWQQHRGRPSRAGYHNKEWAGEMLRIGLRPSHTGKPGGRMLGQRMSHYPIRGGKFLTAANEFLALHPAISWFTTDAVADLPRGLSDFLYGEPRAGRRTKYRCPACHVQAWGKPLLLLKCGICEEILIAIGAP
jgi:hypothetical protein